MNICGLNIKNVFIYKRTHPGDPREEGVFGVENCMGTHRNYKFDAVIGIGGKTCTRREFRPIRERINWVGLGAHKRPVCPKDPTLFTENYINARGKSPLITFDYFKIFEVGNGESYSCDGEIIEGNYPALYRFAYGILPGKKVPYNQSIPIINLDTTEPPADLGDISWEELKNDIVGILEKAANEDSKMPCYTSEELDSFLINSKKCCCGQKTKCSC